MLVPAQGVLSYRQAAWREPGRRRGANRSGSLARTSHTKKPLNPKP